MDFAFVRATDAERTDPAEAFGMATQTGEILGVTRVVLPFVDQSAIRDEADRESVVDAIRRALPAAEPPESNFIWSRRSPRQNLDGY